ncbi:hypothetical protein CYLTODRAFT_424963 [Cylindrobasidium torrendii FP15055 ss-10]|uniref:Uncharacterized protein n=1 Tax=Cylindrobasidium torrendii FP15055 ss-10 TaxID=1314674 RepID=A0A0D7B5E5_9AGAR|nr:hypothetical protein CYLTODRAFT_424963 [Cylindrobasidium torrendii FP15055 ss-10]
MNVPANTSNASLATLLSDSYREIDELKRQQQRPAPALNHDEIRACLASLDDVRTRLVRLLGEDPFSAPVSMKRARTLTDESRSDMSPPSKIAKTTHGYGHISPYNSMGAPSPPHHTTITLPARSQSASVPVHYKQSPPAMPAPPSQPYPAINDLGQRVCRTCGQPGRYKDGKCVEKWGPGPLGPGTVCDRCRKKIKRVERRATVKPLVPQLARNNLPQDHRNASRNSTPTYSPEPLEDLLARAAGEDDPRLLQHPDSSERDDRDAEADELLGSDDEDNIKEEVVDELLDAVDAAEGRS